MSNRGSGAIYLRGSIYWIRYSHRGNEFRESSESTSETVARRLLTMRTRETGKRGAKFLGPVEERLKFEDLAAMFRNDYLARGLRSLRRANASIAALGRFFGLDRAVDITTDRVVAYIAQRQKKDARGKGAANATINRELAALKRMFQIAIDGERLSRAPHIAMLEENNVRQGFLEHADYLALHDALPEHLRDPIHFLYLSGWRVGEMKALEWRDVDLAGNVVRLRPEISKTKDGRVLPLTGELAELIERAQANRRLECPNVFHVTGKPIKDFRGSWDTACANAGLGKLLVHDFRRTAIRNLTRAGVPERVAMSFSGHKTRSVFDRYNIVSEADLLAAAARRDAYLETRPTNRTITKLKPTVTMPQKRSTS